MSLWKYGRALFKKLGVLLGHQDCGPIRSLPLSPFCTPSAKVTYDEAEITAFVEESVREFDSRLCWPSSMSRGVLSCVSASFYFPCQPASRGVSNNTHDVLQFNLSHQWCRSMDSYTPKLQLCSRDLSANSVIFSSRRRTGGMNICSLSINPQTLKKVRCTSA